MNLKTVNGVAAALAFVFALTSTTAAVAKTDISGAWIVTLDFVSSKATIEASIKHNDDKLEATVITPAGKLDFNGTLVNNKISAVYLLQVQGNSLEIRMSGVVDADTLSGTLEFGPGQQVKWTAVRKPIAAAPDTAVPMPAHESAPNTVVETPK